MCSLPHFYISILCFIANDFLSLALYYTTLYVFVIYMTDTKLHINTELAFMEHQL